MGMKPVEWVGASYKDFRAFPDPVQDEMGFALYQAQLGGK
jgi:phage-related protein